MTNPNDQPRTKNRSYTKRGPGRMPHNKGNPKRDRLGGTLDMAALKALRGEK